MGTETRNSKIEIRKSKLEIRKAKLAMPNLTFGNCLLPWPGTSFYFPVSIFRIPLFQFPDSCVRPWRQTSFEFRFSIFEFRGSSRQAGDVEPTRQVSHLAGELFIYLPGCVIHGNQDEVLQHFEVMRCKSFRFDVDFAELLLAIHFDAHHAATRRALHLQFV